MSGGLELGWRDQLRAWYFFVKHLEGCPTSKGVVQPAGAIHLVAPCAGSSFREKYRLVVGIMRILMTQSSISGSIPSPDISNKCSGFNVFLYWTCSLALENPAFHGVCAQAQRGSLQAALLRLPSRDSLRLSSL